MRKKNIFDEDLQYLPEDTPAERKAKQNERLRRHGRITNKTYIEAKKGQDSLQEINDRVCEGSCTGEIYEDMKAICTSVAYSKGYIKKGQSKIRDGGTPDDFLNFMTITLLTRWQKQRDTLGGEVGKTKIENWCAYANTIAYRLLVGYNRSIVDFAFQQMPLQQGEDGSVTEVEFEDIPATEKIESIFLREAVSVKALQEAIDSFPEDLRVHALDSLFYVIYGKFMNTATKNFAIVGAKMLKRSLAYGG